MELTPSCGTLVSKHLRWPMCDDEYCLPGRLMDGWMDVYVHACESTESMHSWACVVGEPLLSAHGTPASGCGTHALFSRFGWRVPGSCTGCNFFYHCAVVLSPRRRMLIVTASNAGSGLAQMAARMALDAALQAVPHTSASGSP